MGRSQHWKEEQDRDVIKLNLRANLRVFLPPSFSLPPPSLPLSLLSYLAHDKQTLSPLWDELLVFDQLIVDSKREHLREDPPLVVINVFDHNKFVSVSLPPPHFQMPLLHLFNASPLASKHSSLAPVILGFAAECLTM